MGPIRIRRFGVLIILKISLFVGFAPAQAKDIRSAADGFPHVETISVQALSQIYDTAVIVDVRTAIEFEVVKINAAVNVPYADGNIVPAVRRLTSESGGVPVVLVDNDRYSPRSFLAAGALVSAGIEHVRVLTEGVAGWLNAFPERSTLMGVTPMQNSQINLDILYARHQLDTAAFAEAAVSQRALVIDIRHPDNRSVIPEFEAVKNIPMDAFLEGVGYRVWSERRLLFFDMDSARTRWLHLFLQANGYMDYAFLQNGVTANSDANRSTHGSAPFETH